MSVTTGNFKKKKSRPTTVYVTSSSDGSFSSRKSKVPGPSRSVPMPLAGDFDLPPPKKDFLLSEDTIRAHLSDFYDDLNSNIDSKMVDVWESLYEKYHTNQYTMVRPTGNPIHSQGFIDMFCSDDIKLIEFSLVSVDSVVIIAEGKSAVATYTVDQRFLYKGMCNEDRAVLSCVLEEVDGDIKIAFEHRTTGQPIPKKTRWDAL